MRNKIKLNTWYEPTNGENCFYYLYRIGNTVDYFLVHFETNKFEFASLGMHNVDIVKGWWKTHTREVKSSSTIKWLKLLYLPEKIT